MLSRTLEHLLNNSFRDAKSKRLEFMTVEHLLLVLLEDDEIREILLSLGAESDELKSDLEKHIGAHVPILPDLDDCETQPTLGFQRVLQVAVFHVQSSGRREVTTANVLVAIYSEKESPAVSLLKQRGIARIDIVNHIANQPSAAENDTEHVRQAWSEVSESSTPCRIHSGFGPFNDEIALELRKGAHHVEEQLSTRCCGVDALRYRGKANTFFSQAGDHLDQMTQ